MSSKTKKLKEQTAQRAAELVFLYALKKKTVKLILTINNGNIKLKKVSKKKLRLPVDQTIQRESERLVKEQINKARLKT